MSEMGYQLSDKTKNLIAARVGIPYEQLIRMDPDDAIKFIENKIGRKLTYDTRFRVDGIPIDEEHIITRKQTEKRLNEIVGTGFRIKTKIKSLFRK